MRPGWSGRPLILTAGGENLFPGLELVNSETKDFPSTTMNPIVHIHAAVTRHHVGETEILGSKEDKLTVEVLQVREK